MIDRPRYTEHILSRLNRGMMLILVGQRRVGKSFLLRLLKQRLEAERPDAKILYINKELQNFSAIRTSDDLYRLAAETLEPGAENYLLIDEVQDIEGYENALRSLHAEERCQIVATGSNAYVFSSELSTRLAGRHIEMPVYSLGYGEFLRFHGLADSEDSLLSYLRVGGLPGLRNFDISDEGQVRDYLQGVYNTILMRDVVARENIRNVTFLENLLRFLADNMGKLISASSISKYMSSTGDKSGAATTASYIRFLSNALLIHNVPRYDLHGKKLFELLDKYYFADHGLRNYLCGFKLRGSIEKVMENVVYNHLRICGYKVTVGILRVGEIDFVATRGEQTIYVQVAYLLASQETIDREFGNLAAIRDNYPKYVVSMDPVTGEMPEYPGIHHVHLRKFLMTEL